MEGRFSLRTGTVNIFNGMVSLELLLGLLA